MNLRLWLEGVDCVRRLLFLKASFDEVLQLDRVTLVYLTGICNRPHAPELLEQVY